MPAERDPVRGSPWRALSRAGGAGPAILTVFLLSACAGGGVSAVPPSSSSAFADTTVADHSVFWWPPSAPADRWYPVALLALPVKKLAVAESGQNRLFIIDRSGATQRLPAPDRRVVEWTALAPGPGLFFFALDGPGRAVHQYDFEGNYLGLAVDLERIAAQHGLGEVEPAGLAVDRSGLAVVTDRSGDRLLVFGPGWTFTGVWSQSGSEPGSWRRPAAVAVGSRPPFLVADEGNRRVVLVDRFGEVVGGRPVSDPPRGVAVLAEDRYAVSLRDRVEFLGPDLVTLRTAMLPRGEDGDGAPYATPALAGDGRSVFAGEGASGRVVELRPRRE